MRDGSSGIRGFIGFMGAVAARARSKIGRAQQKWARL